jgi:hypothetical protein
MQAMNTVSQPRSVFGITHDATQSAESYLKSRDFRIKNKLRSFLITANSSIQHNNRGAMTRSGSTTTTIFIPRILRKKMEIDYSTFFVREDFINLLEEVNCSIREITVTMDTGDKEKNEIQNTIHLHIQGFSKPMGTPDNECLDLGIHFDFLHMPLCGVSNLLINSQLLDHINSVILKRFQEIKPF